VPGLYGRMNGFQGRIEIPDLGAVIGEMSTWTLTRRGNTTENSRDPEADNYDLTADLRFVNEALFGDADYEKRIIIQAGRGQSYVIEPVEGPGQRTALNGRKLVMERVRPCRQE
jgi:hypothetical protein